MGGTGSPDRRMPLESIAGAANGPDVDRAAIQGGATLDGNGLLEHLSVEARRAVEVLCRWRRVDADDVVFEQDDPSQDVYFIVSGRLRIVMYRPPEDEMPQAVAMTAAEERGCGGGPVGSEPSVDGDGGDGVAFEALADEGTPMTLVEMEAGDTFGELSAIDGRMRSARAVALEPAVLAVLDGASFMDLVHGNPDLALALLRRVAGYLRHSNQRMYSLSTLTAKQRVYMQLVRLAEVHLDHPSQWIINPLPAHTDLAFWAGTKRETVAAAIGWLAREGVVMRQNRALIIRHPLRLKALAHV